MCKTHTGENGRGNRTNNINIIETFSAAVVCKFKLTSSFYDSYMRICVLVTICHSLLVSGAPMINDVALQERHAKVLMAKRV